MSDDVCDVSFLHKAVGHFTLRHEGPLLHIEAHPTGAPTVRLTFDLAATAKLRAALGTDGVNWREHALRLRSDLADIAMHLDRQLDEIKTLHVDADGVAQLQAQIDQCPDF